MGTAGGPNTASRQTQQEQATPATVSTAPPQQTPAATSQPLRQTPQEKRSEDRASESGPCGLPKCSIL